MNHIEMAATIAPSELLTLGLAMAAKQPKSQLAQIFLALDLQASEGRLPYSWLVQPSLRVEVKNAADVGALFAVKLRALQHEEFFVLLLDSKGRVIDLVKIGQGTINECGVSTREAYKHALERGAASVVFMHNHPSGDPTPSPEDVSLTSRLQAAGALLDVPMLDHVIIGAEGWYSFSEKRRL